MFLSALGGNFETMDFSMPSYDDKGPSPKAKDAPVFNPFGDFEPKIVDSEMASQKAAEKAAVEAARAQEKAEKEADAVVGKC